MIAFFLFAGVDYQYSSPSGMYEGGFDTLEAAQGALPENRHWAEIMQVRFVGTGTLAQLVLTHTWDRETGVWEEVPK